MKPAINLDSAYLDLILKSATAEEFFGGLEPILKQHQRNFNFAELARKSGFSSRSYVRAIFRGKKNVSLVVIKKFSKPLKFSKEIENLLSLMIDKQTAEVEQLKNRIKIRLEQKRVSSDNNELFRINDWPYVFSALGPMANGATLKEICERSGITEKPCSFILADMLKSEIVKFNSETNRYHAVYDYLNFSELTASDGFLEFYKNVLKQVLARAQKGFESEQSLFHCSVLSVKKKDLPAMTKELQKVLSDFAADRETPDGDAIVTIQSALI